MIEEKIEKLETFLINTMMNMNEKGVMKNNYFERQFGVYHSMMRCCPEIMSDKYETIVTWMKKIYNPVVYEKNI